MMMGLGQRRSSSFSLLALLGVLSCDHSTPARQPSVRRCVIEVRYLPPIFPTTLSVEVSGRSAPLSLLDPSQGPAGLWGADLWVNSGWQSYTLLLDQRRLPDPDVPLSIEERDSSGQLHERSLVNVPNCERGRWFRVNSSRDRFGPRFQLAYERALSAQEVLSAPQSSHRGELVGQALDLTSLEVEVDGIAHPYAREGELLTLNSEGLTSGKHHLTITGKDKSGVPFETFKAPFWVESQAHRWTRGIMYQVVVDRLSPPLPTGGDIPSIGERWGGQLDGVIELLETGYFERMGVSSLWLSPLSPNPDGLWRGVEGGEARYAGYHGYWTRAPREVGAEWGGERALERLVELAHQRGIRVIVDVALNHVHEEHPYVAQHPSWFYPPGCLCGRPGCDWGRYIETCRFTEYLPDLRWEGLDAMKRQVDDALWWIERFDLDGLRVDAVPMMPRRVTRYLSAELHRRFEGLRTRHLLIGETFTGPHEQERIGWYLGPSGLDGQFDFPLMWAMRAALAWESQPLWSVMEAWQAGEQVWSGAAALMGHFVGNHDVTRFVSEAAGDSLSDPWMYPPPQTEDELALKRLWLATALTFTLSGIPVLYYGDEVGLSGANDPDNRRPYWPLGEHSLERLSERRAELWRKVAQLGRLRSCLPSFTDTRPYLTFLSTSDERISFMIGHTGEESVIVLQRAATGGTELALPLPWLEESSWVDALSGEVIHHAKASGEDAVTRLTLPAMPSHSLRVITRHRTLAACQEVSP